MDVLGLSKQASVPLLHVLLGGAGGTLLAWLGVLDAAALKALAKLSVWVFIPSMTFVTLAETLDASRLQQWWFLPVNVLLNHLLGGCLGLAVALLLRVRDPTAFRLVICCVAAGNMGNLPMVVILAVCEADHQHVLFGSECSRHGVSYVCLGMWAAQTVQFSLINRVLAPSDFDPVESCEEVAEVSPVNYGKESELPASVSGVSHRSSDGETPRSSATLLDRCSGWVQPPVIASWAAMFVGTSPAKSWVFGETAILAPLRAVLTHYGHGFTAAAMLTLGGNLMKGPASSQQVLGCRAIAAVVVARLLILPFLGFYGVKLADAVGLLPSDPLFKFVCVLQHGSPSAIALSTICTIHSRGMAEISTLLFWIYLFAVPFLSITLMLAYSTVPHS